MATLEKQSVAHRRALNLFAFLAGAFVAVSLLKFGNPVILEHAVQQVAESLGTYSGSSQLTELLLAQGRQEPKDVYELLFQAWPIRWGYWMLAGLTALCLCATRPRLPKPLWLSILPFAWFVWVAVTALVSIDPALTRITTLYLATVAVCYYLGATALQRAPTPNLFWAPVLMGFFLMLLVGFEQHFGGLEATRQYIYSQVNPQNLPPEYLKRLASNRIFATLIYPNALAGAILLLLPPMTVASWQLSQRLTRPTRLFLGGIVLGAGLACLYWSGSKAGWILAMLQGLILISRTKIQLRWKIAVVSALLSIGIGVFAFRFSTYFGKGAPSMGARMDYWRVAALVFLQHPLLGTGPGTFKVNYQRLKPPEAEMARLVHNDYLQQACDSGLVGMLLYTAFIWGTLYQLYKPSRSDKMTHAVWLGLLGWALQGLNEFSLYVPAVSWTAFLWFGWLTGVAERGASKYVIDTSSRGIKMSLSCWLRSFGVR